MKLFWTLILTITCLNAQALNLKVSTFNIRWFGLGGTMEGSLKDEKRTVSLKDFIKNISKISLSDVISLQEIVDQDKIKSYFPNHTCTGYNNDTPKHQYVMICVKKPMKLVLDGGDNNFTWEDVAELTVAGKTMKLRPAVHGTIQDANGVNLAHMIAVHLKADPEQSTVRIEQINRLKKHIDNDYNDKLPVIIAGDFNAHVTDLTKMKKDDYIMMNEIFNDGKKPMNHIDNLEYTFRAGTTHHTLDHYWISSDLKSTVPAVWPECKKGMTGTKFMDPRFYAKEVSDHCPVTVTLTDK
jgi:endonuclease/exonuclease/phosphatase family metal-dependent hydrolase